MPLHLWKSHRRPPIHTAMEPSPQVEVLAKVCFSVLQHLHVPMHAIGVGYATLACLPAAAMFVAKPLACVSGSKVLSSPMSAAAEHVHRMLSLWRDPTVWLLSPTNLTFGFCAAFMNGYVNGELAAPELGASHVAMLSAMTPVVAAISSPVLGRASDWLGKGMVLAAGAGAFLSIALCILTLGCCRGWRWWIAVLFACHGVGRAVYESTNRAAFADNFRGERTSGAFANCALQSNLAFAISFLLQGHWPMQSMARTVAGLAVATPVLYMATTARRRSSAPEDGMQKPLSEASGA